MNLALELRHNITNQTDGRPEEEGDDGGRAEGVDQLDELYVGVLVFLCLLCLPPSLFVIIFVLRHSRLWTTVNLLIVWGRLISLTGLLLPIALVIGDVPLLCAVTHLYVPLLILHEKIVLSAVAFLRYTYIFCQSCLTGLPPAVLNLLLVSLSLVTFALPTVTLYRDLPPLYMVCSSLPFHTAPSYTFLFVYMVTWVNTLLVDIFSYIRILNYMRLNSVRVNILPSTSSERKKVVNIVTASSSFLVWLVSVACMLPTILLQYQSPWSLPYNHHRITGHYHMVLIFILCSCNNMHRTMMRQVVPVMYIGSSHDMRSLLSFLQNRVEEGVNRCCGIGREQPRANVYTISQAENDDG